MAPPHEPFNGADAFFREGSEAIKALNTARADLTEDSLALQFSAKHANRLRYVAKWGKWYEWVGTHWQEDATIHVFDMVRAHIRETAMVANVAENTRKNLLKANTVAAVERLARADRRHAATVDQWDADPWLLNTPGDIVDLRTRGMRPHDPMRYMTKITAVAPGGACPRWLQFLNEITQNDKDLVAFLQRLVGYALTGTTREHAFAFFYGTGANGKGTFLNTVTALLNDYAAVAPTNVFTESKGERHPTELAMLRGARFVSAQETEEGRPWAEAKIKAVTGGDPITARFMRQDFFTYTPQFKLIIAGNHKPRLGNVDEAMRRRLFFVPFTVTIPPQDRDPGLPDKLRIEMGGILAWAIEGCLAWQREGLNAPEVVRAATVEYFRDQDALRQWIEDCCEIGPDCWHPPRELFNSWVQWCADAHEQPGTEKAFTDRLDRAGFTAGRDYRGRFRKGIKLPQGPPCRV